MVDIRDRLHLWADTDWDVAKEAVAEIDRLRAEVERLKGALRNSIPAVPDDGYLPGLNSTMCDAPLRSPEEQFTRRMLREAIARCLFTGLPDEREWTWDKFSISLECRGFEFATFKRNKRVALWPPEQGWSIRATIPAPIWDKAWKECGMEDR